MIIWRGIGAVVVAIVFLCSLGANLITNIIAPGASYYDHHKWPFGVSLIVAALITWFLGAYMQSRPAKVMIDKATGKEVEMKKRHDFFFIPMKWWGPILAVAGIVVIALEFIK